jgi:hypothetical protein
MTLSRFGLILLLALGQFSAFAASSDSCATRCEWGPANNPEDVDGGGNTCDDTTFQDCAADARALFIQIDNETDEIYTQEMKAAYRAPKSFVTFANSLTNEKIECSLIPIKTKYDVITAAEEKADREAHDGHASQSFINKLDQNIALECMMM